MAADFDPGVFGLFSIVAAGANQAAGFEQTPVGRCGFAALFTHHAPRTTHHCNVGDVA